MNEQEVLSIYSTPGLRKNVLTRADKKVEPDAGPKAEVGLKTELAASDTNRPVISLTDERLVRAGEAAMAHMEKNSGEIRMAVFKMVRGLIAAKETYKSQLAFNKWLVTSEYWNLEKNDRSALIELADYPAQELLQFLGETDLISPQEILAAFKQKSTPRIVGTISPPPDDPIFALVPEVKPHLSEVDGALVVNSREVAQLFFHNNHQQLIRHIMWSIWNDPMQPNYHDEFQQRPDGTVDITSRGLLSATNHWGFEYEESTRHREFTCDWIDWLLAEARKYEAKTGINPAHAALEKVFGPGHYFTDDGRECCRDCRHPLPAGPALHDELWATIAQPDEFLCLDCIEKRLGRTLTQADLTICAFNAGWIEFDGADVATFARGRRLLPLGATP